MNLGELKTRVKRQFGDEAAVQISDDDITRWANDGQRDIVTKNEDIKQHVTTINIVTGVQSYLIPAVFMLVQSITCKMDADLSYIKLEGRSLQQYDIFVDGWDGNQYGLGFPSIYTIFADEVKLFPIPQFDATAGLKFYGSKYPVDLTIDADEIDLPKEYHNAVVDYCLSKAHELDENWDGSAAKMAQVEQNVRLNRNRQDWKNTDFYPMITIANDDYWN